MSNMTSPSTTDKDQAAERTHSDTESNHQVILPNTPASTKTLTSSEAAVDGPATQASGKLCENCGFELDGPFCGRCGQPVRSTIAFFGSVVMHFLDDIFGFDSRAGRTVLPLIFRPGFLTNEYFRGRRVHYVPPLRLYFFVSIMFFLTLGLVTSDSMKELKQLQQSQSLVTVADLTGQIEQLEQQKTVEGYQINAVDQRRLENLNKQKRETIATINEQILDFNQQIKQLNPNGLPLEQLDLQSRIQIIAFERGINDLQLNLDEHPNLEQIKDINKRLGRLDERLLDGDLQQRQKDNIRREELELLKAELIATTSLGQLVAEVQEQNETVDEDFRFNVQPNLSFLSQEQNKQLELFFAEMEQKAKVAVEQDAVPLVKQMMGVLPQLMFVLLPIFALILKIFYLFSRRYYMEHVTVALHSHAFIFLVLMIVFASATIHEYVASDQVVVKDVTEGVIILLTTWMPIYLFLMQKKVYRQGFFMTFIKYVMVGFTYVLLLSFATVVAFFWGLAKV